MKRRREAPTGVQGDGNAALNLRCVQKKGGPLLDVERREGLPSTKRSNDGRRVQ